MRNQTTRYISSSLWRNIYWIYESITILNIILTLTLKNLSQWWRLKGLTLFLRIWCFLRGCTLVLLFLAVMVTAATMGRVLGQVCRIQLVSTHTTLRYMDRTALKSAQILVILHQIKLVLCFLMGFIIICIVVLYILY